MVFRLPSPLRQSLTEIGSVADEEIIYGEAGLLLASIDRPGVILDPYRRHLSTLITEVAEFADLDTGLNTGPATLDLKSEALIQVINRRYGYGGIEGGNYEPESLNLMRVIDNRSGASLALALLFLHVASELGWSAHGINFPGCFLVLLTEGSSRLIIDPYSGNLVETQDLRGRLKAAQGNDAELEPRQYQELSKRSVLLVLQGQIKICHIMNKRFEAARQTLAVMLMFAPEEAELWRETGMLNAHINNTPEAISAFETYLDKTDGLNHPWSEGRDTVTKLLRQLKNNLN